MKKNEDKVLVFSPSGFILKLLFSAVVTGMAIGSIKADPTEYSIFYVIFNGAMIFFAMWFVATLFGFCLRATGNYIIAVIVMMIMMGLMVFAENWLEGKDSAWEIVSEVIFLLISAGILVNDIRKGILYVKNTV